MADNQVLRIEDDGAVRVLTLDRPEARNAFNGELYEAVRVALGEAAADDSVTVCVLTGAGDIFSAGQDLKVLAGLKDDPAATSTRSPGRWRRSTSRSSPP